MQLNKNVMSALTYVQYNSARGREVSGLSAAWRGMAVCQSRGVQAPHTPDLEASEKPSFLQTAVFFLMKSGLSSRAWRRMGNGHTNVRPTLTTQAS